jgi:hypothetical protein
MAIRDLSLAVIIPKLDFGINVIQRHARTDKNGRDFLEGIVDWSRRVVVEAKCDLARNQVELRPFEHPIERTILCARVDRDSTK